MTDPSFECYDHIAVPVFVLETDANGIPRYVACNTCASCNMGLETDEVIGQTARELYMGRFGQTMFLRHLKTFAEGKTTTYEREYARPEGTKWESITLTPQLDDAGNVKRIVVTNIDVTHEHQIRAANTSLVTATAEMEQFVAIAAHDLRAPMRNVKILSEFLRDAFEDHGDGKVELLDLLDEVADKSSILISEVLLQAQQVNVPPKRVSFDISELCQSICDVLDPRALHVITWTPEIIQGDKATFQIALRNLLDNAIKHGGEKRLEISISVAQKDEKTLSVCITDNGKGFDNPGLVFIETGKYATDCGYGLLGVRRLLTARGGTICVADTNPRQGGIVTFTLPGKVITPVVPNTKPTLMCHVKARSVG